MDRRDLREAITPLPVWDTHTHLVGSRLPARDFWEVAHYFWFLRELVAAGYPVDHARLPEAERIEAFLRAFRATGNTSMSWVVRRIFARLYGVELSDAAGVRRADEAVRARAAEPGWARHVCAQLNIERIVVNEPPDADFANLAGVSCLVPRVEERLVGWLERLDTAADPGDAGEAVAAELGQLL